MIGGAIRFVGKEIFETEENVMNNPEVWQSERSRQFSIKKRSGGGKSFGRCGPVFLLAWLLGAGVLAPPQSVAQPTFLQDEITGQALDGATTKVIVLIHGWNPDDNPDAYAAAVSPEWNSLFTALKAKLTGSDWKLVKYHWERQGTVTPSIGANTGPVLEFITDAAGYGNATVAAVRAEQQGVSLSVLLNSQSPSLRRVHFIAHSAGSWAAREAMRLLLSANSNVVCEMTLLDPFIPDASTLVGTTTGLSTAKMNATAGLPGNGRVQRLEDYWADDLINPFLPKFTISTPGVPFSWRAGDVDLQVDWGDAGFPGCSLWYDDHSGPIQFYASTVYSADSAYISPGLNNPAFDLNNIGWKKSLFYQEQQLRATITSVSPAVLPVSYSPQRVTIYGTNFKLAGDANASSLIFYDPANNPYPRTPINVTATSMQYDLTVQAATGTWKVKVVNGGVESLPFSFSVASSGSQLSGLAISGPATIPENNGGQFTATAYFSDGSSSTVTSSTSWSENSSATTISSSGWLSAGSVGSDTAVTVSASYTLDGVTKATSANVTVVDSGSGGGTTTVHPLVNGTFESGLSPWAPNGYAGILAGSYPHLGSWYAYLCNANSADGSFSQFFPLPAGTIDATIQFYLNIVTEETAVYTAYDTMKVDVVTANEQYVGTIAQFSNLDKGANANGSYVLKSYNIMSMLSAYRGQSMYLVFSGHTDSTYSTIFRIDDVDVTLTVNNPVSLTGLSIRGPSSIPEGRGDSFWADAIFSDGTTQTISPNSWSENSSVTSISSDGFLSAGAVSADTPVTVTASYTFNGVNRQATKIVTIVNTNATHVLSSLAVSGPASMNENSSGQFVATAMFTDGTSQSVTPSWSENSSATSISTGGLLTAGEVASDTTVTVSASYTTGGVTRGASQDVLVRDVASAPTLVSLSIGGPSSMNKNSATQYVATALMSDGTSQTVSATWSENSAATTISAGGMLSAGEVASDTVVTVSASYTVGGVTRSAQKAVTVLNTVVVAYTLNVSAVNGTVAKSPDQGSYSSGSQVVLTAAGATGYGFESWSGDATGNQNPLTVTMDSNKSITANFAPSTRTIGLGGNLAFGTLITNTTATRTLTITNSGNTALNVSSISYPTGFSGAWSGSVSPRGTQGVVVTFSPPGVGNYGGTATVNSDATGGTSSIGISGVGVVGAAPPQLGAMVVSNGIFRFALRGPAGSNYVVQVSSNLVNWSVLLTNVIPAAGVRVLDVPILTNQSRMFYRALPLAGGPLVLQPGPQDAQDIWTATSFTGVTDGKLWVGGWGDTYNVYLKFDLSVLPRSATSATVWLYSGQGPHPSTRVGMYLDRVTQSWDALYATGIMSWSQKPSSTDVRTLAAPSGTDVWYGIDITDLYNGWQAGTYANYGIALRPQGTSCQFNYFRSSRNSDSPLWRPMLVVTP